jgi:hypothetical protein
LCVDWLHHHGCRECWQNNGCEKLGTNFHNPSP